MKGHVRRQGAKWFAIIYQGRRINGKGKLSGTYRWIGGFEREEEAEAELTRQLSSRLEGSYVEPAKLTLGEYLTGWLAAKKSACAPLTHQGYVGLTDRYIVPALGPVPLQKLSAFDVEGFYARALVSGGRPRRGEKKKVTRGLSPRTVLHVHRLLHKAIGDAVKKKLVSFNVIDAAQAPRPIDREMQAPDENATAFLLAEAQKNDRLWLPVLIASGTGLRRREILALRWQDLTFSTSTAVILRSLCQTKEGLIFKSVKRKKSRRVIVFPEFVIEALKEARIAQRKNREAYGAEYQDNDLICCLPDGAPVPPNDLSADFSRFRRALMLQTRFHDLRHGHASQALRAGVPVKTIQQRLGHATAAFTLDVYGHCLPGDDERAAETIQRTLGAAFQKELLKPVN